ncbi:UDP-N-acetylenolpyruvoylglucosamine reductase [Acidimicrobium ferrooxidans DSM 10331]|uniref:UDP-N-acetylenolpyruvoylglucosamine reductase n=1 Tax=Acidimicrobium ferrooxidans (strain DSM 10331 / JCM 15462 / NBRC 103882 / ICP) TaxID=525909 RepID=C7LZL6_ACIFD|nr:UDP-N-acetylmuramate dehydrogenase [Acidimicrobium ferrooxidans]ACU54174.1 UDP-N-acetylenolpyruvoylglucosamine reductase [Acidimicrobium ferrooxidans DSM 10331]
MSDLVRLGGELGIEVHREVPLGARTTYRVGGSARWGVVLERVEDVAAIAALVRAAKVPILVLGAGSNMLVADRGFDGLLVELGAGFAEIEAPSDGPVILGGAVLLPVAARRLAAVGRAGMAWAVGIPGSVGGAVRMNAGGHGGDMAAVLGSAVVADVASGQIRRRSREALEFGYRHSALLPTEVVLEAELELAGGDRAHEEAMIKEVVRWRRAHQPGGHNAGSVFVNPPEAPAAKLIDEAGLRGYRLGSAEVSPKHANFIQADPGGSADDVRALMEFVRAEVARRVGVELRTEVRLVGFTDSTTHDANDRGASGAES